MKHVLIILVLFFSLSLQAQDQFLEMSEKETGKVRTFKENKRVKVKTLEGKKFIGRFEIVDDNSIEIEGNTILLNSISNIKSRSVIAGIAGTGLILYGSLWIFGGVLLHIWPESPQLGNGFLAAGAIITASGIFFNEFARNQRNDNWSYKIIEK